MGKQSFGKILACLQAAVDKLETLGAYKTATENEPFRPTQGQKMLWEGKKLRVQEMPSELDRLQNQLVRAALRLEELLPTLPRTVSGEEIKSGLPDVSIWEVMERNALKIDAALTRLKNQRGKNPWSEEKTAVLSESLALLLREFALYMREVFSEEDIAELQARVKSGHEVLSADEIDALLTSWNEIDIDLSDFPDETDEERYKHRHGIGYEPESALVSVSVETWLEEKHSQTFCGWMYAMHYLSQIKNKKSARLCEHVEGLYLWISRHKELRYGFDGETVTEEVELPRVVSGYEDDEYRGKLPPDIPRYASLQKSEANNALTEIEPRQPTHFIR